VACDPSPLGASKTQPATGATKETRTVILPQKNGEVSGFYQFLK
jgi:hypothetical protein